MNGQNTLCITNEILEEYSEIIGRLINAEIADYVIGSIINCPFVQCVEPYYHFHLIEADPDDNKFVDCALAIGASYIVSNDHHYDILKTIDYPKIDVIGIKEFYEKYRAELRF
jgi:predicted nucleic acid-binding protein